MNALGPGASYAPGVELSTDNAFSTVGMICTGLAPLTFLVAAWWAAF
jgi:hypothetical protein